MDDLHPNRRARWYFGGLSAAAATCFTHPLDLLKVRLQTHQVKLKVSEITLNIVRDQGFIGLYCGLSAAFVRQLIYSTSRFGIYEILQRRLPNESNFGYKIITGGIAGSVGGFLGTPTDVVNIRMQNDSALPRKLRRNYVNVFDGLLKIQKYEGAHTLFKGSSVASARAFFMGVGQLAFYDIAKSFCLSMTVFQDNFMTHFVSSFAAGAIATGLSQPVDVVKTRYMNARPGEYSSIAQVVFHTAKLGPVGFFKGYIPAFLRNGPQTILTFVFLEQLRKRYGFLPAEQFL